MVIEKKIHVSLNESVSEKSAREENEEANEAIYVMTLNSIGDSIYKGEPKLGVYKRKPNENSQSAVAVACQTEEEFERLKQKIPPERRIFLIEQYLNGNENNFTPEQKNWFKGVRMAQGALIHRLEVQPILDAFEARKSILNEGRTLGVKKRQETAKERMIVLTKAIADLFDRPEKQGWGWTNNEIVTFLIKSNYGYAESTVLVVVKKEAAKHRKARKERQASQHASR